MKRIAVSPAIAACLLWASLVLASEPPTYIRNEGVIHGAGTALSKAAGDTIDLMGPTGSGAAFLGDFEAGWNGWTSVDVTEVTVSHWQVSSYNQAVGGNLAAWCGDLGFAGCNDSLDVVGGYGNNWHDQLAFRTTVADPAVDAVVSITAQLQYDVETGYDYIYLSTKTQGSLGYTDLEAWTDAGTVPVNAGFTYQPTELLDGSDVELLFRVKSDAIWSDEDCMWPTAGACQLDDISVVISQAGLPDLTSFTDFQDGTLGAWELAFPTGVGDFAALWSGLEDEDACSTNYTQQVAFIDDGLVVPGTGGSECINWCYGPFGYIVNTTGGLAGPAFHIQNNVLSPVMAWPDASFDGAVFAFDVYRHEDLSFDSPGIFYVWGVRSADTDGSAGHGVQTIADQSFVSRNFIYYGGPGYLRAGNDLTDLVNPGRDEVQVMLGVYQMGWLWGWNGNDGYPAPYFDNVSVKVFPVVGPAITARPMDLAQDNFPEVDTLNLTDLGSMHVRFDMAGNISPAADLRNDPGDSIVVDVAVVRDGATAAGDPELHYVIDANPLFDAYRTTPTSGFVAGAPATRFGLPIEGRWAFDLPDSGTLFPGDVLHYYIRAADVLGGDIRYATLPADLTGFGDFSDPLAYDRNFVVQALPTIRGGAYGYFDTPELLFWNDFAERGGEEEWFGALRNLGLEAGLDFDIYSTNQPSSGVGNGIGGRTNGPALERYDAMIYSSGNLGLNTLSNGDFQNDAGDDIGAVINWLAAGNKGLFLTGDGVASDVAFQSGTSGQYFAEKVLGVTITDSNLRVYINNQAAPLVYLTQPNPVFHSVEAWIAYGGCPGINTFDAVTARVGATRLAEFTDWSGNPGAYTFSAATLNINNSTNKIVSLPYDLMSIYTRPGGKSLAPLATRVELLRDIIDYFGFGFIYYPAGATPTAERFAVSNAPNPFNPRTSIAYSVDKPGRLMLKIFNVRGQLVRTLIDRRVETSGKVMWDGTDNNGQQLASGVYFREARLNDKIDIGKMMLIK